MNLPMYTVVKSNFELFVLDIDSQGEHIFLDIRDFFQITYYTLLPTQHHSFFINLPPLFIFLN